MGLFKRYKNPHIKYIKRTPFHFLAWMLGVYKDSEKKAIPEDFIYPLIKRDEAGAKATFVNHCTYVLEIFNLVFVTDPIWSERCSPFSFLGPKRSHDPHIQIKDLKKIDYVLISHNHYDHLDLDSVREIYNHFPKVTFIVPVGLKRWFERKGIENVVELDWWQSISFQTNKHSPEIEIVATPAQHHSGRGPFDSNKSLWAGYMVTVKDKARSKRFYFAGDTAYNPYDFKSIGARYKDVDLSICPIGTYLPKKFMETVHLSPEHAVSIHKDINPKLSLGMHWGTFRLSEEPHNAPPYDLYQEMKKQNLDHSLFLPIPPGDCVNW